MKKAIVAVVVSLLMAGVAQAASIGINLSTGDSSSTVSSGFSGGSTIQTNWNNWNMDSNSFVASPVDSNGAAVTSGLSMGLDLAWGGGWSYYFAVENGNAPANTLGYSTWSAAYGPIVHISNIPYATYDVAVLHGGWGNDFSWTVETGLTSSSYTTPSYENGGGKFAAIQIIGPVPEPATLSVLALGGLATLIRRRNRR
ncbi:MAG: PEP-CTERM sorting domain-containing protein [Planctomycetota bacterium]|nr:PEP-CTERM sorting domain-containing protein [Planctomycetota bacterium]